MVKVVHRMPATPEGGVKEQLQQLLKYEESMTNQAESPRKAESEEQEEARSGDASVLRQALTRVSSERDKLKMRVFFLESELSRVRDECGDLSRRCQVLETDKAEAAELLQRTFHYNFNASHNALRHNQLLEQLGKSAPPPCDGEGPPAVRSRTEEWVMEHKGVQLEFFHEPWEGSILSSAWGADSQGAHINPDDSASQEGAWRRVAVGSHQEPSGGDGEALRLGDYDWKQLVELSRRMCPQGQQRAQRADKVARSPWKTSVDVNPVYNSQMLFGRLMGNMASKAAAAGPLEDCLSREAFY